MVARTRLIVTLYVHCLYCYTYVEIDTENIHKIRGSRYEIQHLTAADTVDVANMKHSSACVSALGRCQVRASACYNTEIFNPQTKGDDMEMLFLCFFHPLALRDSGM